MSDTEDSRVASLGRKRRQNPDVLQSAREAEKRRKLDTDANFVALDSDDNSETVSEDRESGEVSSISNNSITHFDNPSKISNTKTPQDTTSRSRKRDAHPSRAPDPSAATSRGGIDLDAVYPDTLQKLVREQLEERDDFESVDAVLAEYSQVNKPHRKQAYDCLQDFNHGFRQYLGEYSYADLKKLVQDTHAFDQPLDIDAETKKLAKKIGVGERDFCTQVHAKCEEEPWKSCAEVVFDQLKTHQNHIKACRVLRTYLDESLIPEEERPIDRPEVIELDDSDDEEEVADQNNANQSFDARNNVRLSELSEEELRDQALYANLTDPNDLVRCLSCGDRGHMQDYCPANTCSHCHSKSHFSRACPSHQKCSRCRQRGHRSATCSRPSKMAGGIGDECDVCGERGHAEEECSGIWQTFKPSRENVKVISEDEMAMACYNCGRTTHWGDDCPALPDFVEDCITFDTWSGKNASRYIAGRAEALTRRNDVASAEQENNGGMPAHQVAMLGEWA
jgi:hypothetical protein